MQILVVWMMTIMYQFRTNLIYIMIQQFILKGPLSVRDDICDNQSKGLRFTSFTEKLQEKQELKSPYSTENMS